MCAAKGEAGAASVLQNKSRDKMRNITFQLNCKLEERLRKYTGRKGDLSRVLNEAVEMWLNHKEKV